MPPSCSSDAPATAHKQQVEENFLFSAKTLSFWRNDQVAGEEGVKEKPQLYATVRPRQRQGQCRSGSQRQGTSRAPTVPGHVTFPQEEDQDRLSDWPSEELSSSSSAGHISGITQGAPHDVLGSLLCKHALKIPFVEVGADPSSLSVAPEPGVGFC